MVDTKYVQNGARPPRDAEDRRILNAERFERERPLPPYATRANYLLSEILNDSATMTGTTAKDVFDTGAAAIPIVDTAGSVGTGGVGFARSDHVHLHADLRGGTLHALASSLTHGFMSATDKAALDALVLGVLIIENRTSDPASPATGRIWLRTDL